MYNVKCQRKIYPLLQKMSLLEVMVENDNSPLQAGAVDPDSRVTYGDILKLQQEEGIDRDWHKRVVGALK